MSDYDLPELPSDDELGITDADREALEELPDDRPEMSAEEMSSLLGEMFSPAEPPPESAAPNPKAEKKRKKKELKEQKKREKLAEASAKAGAPPPAPVAPKGEPPRSRWKGPITAAILVLVAVISSTSTGGPRPVPANAPDTAFSSSRAMSMLIEIAREAHPTGSPEHTRVREFLVDRLRSLGLDPEVQTATAMSPLQSSRVATVRNIVARLPGTAPTGAILLMAHYDTKELAPGAGDDASGVVTILEALRALRSGEPLRNDVIVLFSDAEELGLIGVQAFMDEHPWMDDVTIALTFEMRGAGGPSVMSETNADNGFMLTALKEAVPYAFANSISDEVYQRMPNFTDFTPMKQAGVQGMMFAAFGNAHVYHQASDTPENVDESSLQHHGLHALGLLRHLGDAELTDVDAPSLVAFNIPLVGLVVHSRAWVLPLTGVMLAVVMGGLFLTVRAGGRLWAIVLGLALAAGGIALGYWAGVGLLGWATERHAEAGSLSGSMFHGEGWYVIALACIALAVVSGVHSIARKWLSLPELATGAILIPAAAATWLSVSMPLGAPNLQWPALAAAVSVLIVAGLGARSSSAVGSLATLLLALPALALLVPLTELLWLALSLRMAGLIGVLMVSTLLLILPVLDSLRHPNSLWAPASFLVLGGASAGLGALAAPRDAATPAPSTLVYAFEHGGTEGLWATTPVVDSVDIPARDWAVEVAGSAFGRDSSLATFGYRGGEMSVTSGPALEIAPPTVVVQSDTTWEGLRRVTLGVRSQVGAEMMRFQADERGETRLRTINGLSVDGLAAVEHWGIPDTLVVLELEMPAGDSIGLEIVEHLLRPEELLGVGVFQRPSDLAPDESWMSDRAMLKTSLLTRIQADSTGATPDSLPDDGQPASRLDGPAGQGHIEVEYIAHASFLLRADDGTELLIDPYASRVWLGYDWPEGVLPTAVLITHPHYDHDAGRFRGMPFPWGDGVLVIDGPGTYDVGEFKVTGVAGKHADPYGMEFGQLNTIMVVEAAGLRIVHLGDNGPLTPAMVAGVGRVDVLMMPGDGVDHILSQETTAEILAQLAPRVVVPMHYRLPDLEGDPDSPSDLGEIEPWLEGRAGVSRVRGHVTRLSPTDLPASQTILVFEHAPYVQRE